VISWPKFVARGYVLRPFILSLTAAIQTLKDKKGATAASRACVSRREAEQLTHQPYKSTPSIHSAHAQSAAVVVI